MYMIPVTLAACLSLAPPSPARVVSSASPARILSSASRRALLHKGAAAAALPLLLSLPAVAQGGVPEGMRTSESYTNLQQISPETTGTLGAGTMSSRSRPVTGVVLLEEVQESGKKTAPTVSAELVLDGGVAATATFDAQYPLNRGMFYDVEVRNLAGEGAFLQVASLPEGKSLGEMSASFLTKSVFSTEGRFGAYGAPTDIKVLSKSEAGAMRLLEISFAALSPGGNEVRPLPRDSATHATTTTRPHPFSPGPSPRARRRGAARGVDGRCDARRREHD